MVEHVRSQWGVLPLIAAWILLQAWSITFAANNHGTTDATEELRATLGDVITPFVVNYGCLPAVPSNSLTFGTFSCSLYAKNNTNGYTIYVTQTPAAALGPLTSGNGTYWLAMHKDLSGTVAGWNRQAGTHYLWQFNASQPTNPNGGLVAAQITVAGGKITAIYPAMTSSSSRSPSMGIMYAADYGVTCDGSTEVSGKLQQAMVLAATNGVALQLPSGSCVIRNTMIAPARLHLIGAPNGELYWDTPQSGTFAVLNLVDVSEVTIEFVRIRGTNTSASFNATYAGNYPIRIDHSSANTIRNCHIQDYWGDAAILIGPGVTATNHSDVNLVEGNIILRGSSYGIEITSGSWNRILGNYLEDTNLGLNNGGSGIVSQNTFADNIQLGVMNVALITSIGGATGNDTINTFQGNKLINARVSASGNFLSGLFIGNLIVGATTGTAASAPLALQNANGSQVKNNVITAPNYSAIFTTGLGTVYCTTCADTDFEGNYIANAPNANGIAFNASSRVAIRNNRITGNGANGIELAGANADITIENNSIYDNNAANNTAYFGINLNGSGANVSTRTIVRSNKIFSPVGNKQAVPFQGALDVETVFAYNILYPRQNASAWQTASSVNPHFYMNKAAAVSECGTFTLANAATTTVTNGNGITPKIQLIPTNAAAGTLMGSSKSLFISAVSSWSNFSVRTADNTSAAGTETFSYCLLGN